MRFVATNEFWKNFYNLPPEQKTSVRQKWQVFKQNPRHPSLRVHKIEKLTNIAGHPIRSVVIEQDLRVIFRIDGDTVTTLDIGNHDIYK